MFFSQPYKGRTEWYYYVGTILLTMMGYLVIGQLPLLAVSYYQMQQDNNIGVDELERFNSTMDFSILGLSQNVGLLLMLVIFIFAMIGLYLGVKYLHKRSFKTLITPFEHIDWKKILFGFGLWFGLTALVETAQYLIHSDSYTFQLQWGKFLTLVLISFLIIPIQTSWEELVMRGYLMPGLGLITKNKWLPLLITSLIFALLHGMNPEVEKYGIGIMATYYIGAGLFLGLITVMDDSLELALGVHAATNIFAALFITFEGSVLQTDAIFRVNDMSAGWMTMMFFICAAIFYVICYNKYNWRALNTIFYPIEDNLENKTTITDELT